MADEEIFSQETLEKIWEAGDDDLNNDMNNVENALEAIPRDQQGVWNSILVSPEQRDKLVANFVKTGLNQGQSKHVSKVLSDIRATYFKTQGRSGVITIFSTMDINEFNEMAGEQFDRVKESLQFSDSELQISAERELERSRTRLLKYGSTDVQTLAVEQVFNPATQTGTYRLWAVQLQGGNGEPYYWMQADSSFTYSYGKSGLCIGSPPKRDILSDSENSHMLLLAGVAKLKKQALREVEPLESTADKAERYKKNTAFVVDMCNSVVSTILGPIFGGSRP